MPRGPPKPPPKTGRPALAGPPAPALAGPPAPARRPPAMPPPATRCASTAARRCAAASRSALLGCSAFEKENPHRNSLRSDRAKLTGRLSIRNSLPSAPRWNRSGKAASSSTVAAGKPATGLLMRLSMKFAVSVRSVCASGLIVAPSLRTRRLSASNPTLPPSSRLISTVSPRTKSNTRTLGVNTCGFPNCWIDGAPSSSVCEKISSTPSTGRQLAPKP